MNVAGMFIAAAVGTPAGILDSILSAPWRVSGFVMLPGCNWFAVKPLAAECAAMGCVDSILQCFSDLIDRFVGRIGEGD